MHRLISNKITRTTKNSPSRISLDSQSAIAACPPFSVHEFKEEVSAELSKQDLDVSSVFVLDSKFILVHPFDVG